MVAGPPRAAVRARDAQHAADRLAPQQQEVEAAVVDLAPDDDRVDLEGADRVAQRQCVDVEPQRVGEPAVLAEHAVDPADLRRVVALRTQPRAHEAARHFAQRQVAVTGERQHRDAFGLRHVGVHVVRDTAAGCGGESERRTEQGAYVHFASPTSIVPRSSPLPVCATNGNEPSWWKHSVAIAPGATSAVRAPVVPGVKPITVSQPPQLAEVTSTRSGAVLRLRHTTVDRIGILTVGDGSSA